MAGGGRTPPGSPEDGRRKYDIEPYAESGAFARRQARWIRERKWHPTARLQEEIDGSLMLHLKVAETSEIKRWVMQFGSEAEVVRPASLRKAVKDDLQAATKLYRGRRPRTRKDD